MRGLLLIIYVIPLVQDLKMIVPSTVLCRKLLAAGLYTSPVLFYCSLRRLTLLFFFLF